MAIGIIPCTKASCGFWIPATYTAFGFVPPALQLPFLNMCGFFWTM